MGRLRTAGVALALAAAFVGLRYLALREEPPVIDTSSKAWTLRESALERARVFVNAPVRPAATGFVPISDTPSTNRPLRCTYVPRPIRGTTPKFDCRLPTGEVVKIKYGANPEVPAEIAATRLLAALGFGADQVAHVAKVECVGCPPHPFRTRQAAEILFMSGLLDRTLNFDRVRSFDHVAVERKFDAEPIEVGDMDGWEWSDLDRVNESRGGASRAELDALRLVAVLLAHWDNKPSNQRFVCLDWPLRDGGSSKTREESECRQPLLMLQDLGATFGPRKVNHRNWAETPVWESADGCIATMMSLPYNGATFRRVAISEDGRALLASRLNRLSEAEIQKLFRDAGFPDPATGESPSDFVTPWVDTLQDKIRQITEHAPCSRKF